jgi:hypothetical protein
VILRGPQRVLESDIVDFRLVTQGCSCKFRSAKENKFSRKVLLSAPISLPALVAVPYPNLRP